MKRKEVVIGASGVVLAVIALVAIALVWNTVNNLEERTGDLEQRLTEAENTVDELGDEVGDLEERLTEAENTVDDLEQRLSTIENKTWHAVGDFTLSPSKTSQGFHIQGEEWRLNFTFNQVVTGIQIGYNIRVYDDSGNIVGGLGGIELADIENTNCILNIREGQGDFTVEITGMAADFTLSFTVEEFY